MKWIVSPIILSICAVGFTAISYAAPPISKTPASQQPAKKVEIFKSFTGKILANKVRIRAKADLESHIVRQVNKNDLLLIVAEEGDFYAVQPLKDTKAYVFRSYVLDDIVEASRVNVRLEPHVDAPIIGQLQAGDKVSGQVCAINHKWLEIAPPATTRFYVSKEFVSQAGGPEYLTMMEKRKTQLEEQLSKAFFVAEAECKKNYEEMSILEPTEMLQTIVRNFTDFPEALEQAKQALALLKETYLQKKIIYLESKAELSSSAKEELLSKHQAENQELFKKDTINVNSDLWGSRAIKKELSNQMHLWDTIEESLFLSWSTFHTGKKFDDFYAEQKANASVISGIIDSYGHPVKNKPGDFILRSEDAPLAYLYSTRVDLSKLTGKKVTLLVSPRPNNHFAFPAYYVLSVE
jgi:uncharacterized protein YgiM (DUF1202 family)